MTASPIPLYRPPSSDTLQEMQEVRKRQTLKNEQFASRDIHHKNIRRHLRILDFSKSKGKEQAVAVNPAMREAPSWV